MPFAIAQPPNPDPPDDFVLNPDPANYAPVGAEPAYLGALNDVRGRLAAAAGEDRARQNNSQVLTEARDGCRRDALVRLRADAEKFIAGQLPATDAAAKVYEHWGAYKVERERVENYLFVIDVPTDPATGLATDVSITLNNHLPPAPSDKKTLYVALEAADNIIRTVCEASSREPRWWPILSWLLGWLRGPAVAEGPTRGRRLRHIYVHKLAGIGRIGLEGPHSELATLALDGLRREFALSEAGRIKNKYLRRLGVACFGAAMLMLLGYFAVRLNWVPPSNFLHFHQPFWLVGAGAAMGTWASFSIRRQALTFDDLAVLEDDLLEPVARVAFVLLLTVTISLLFWTGAVQIEIGLLKTAEFKGARAFLIGLFCGISERALATAVSGRATAFVRGLGGG